jgi:hypothetical protein
MEDQILKILVFESSGNIKPCPGCGHCGTPAMTERSIYPQKAYELGKNL